MPATSEASTSSTGIDASQLARDRQPDEEEFGTALKPGQQVMITKVVVKKDSHIEFQLGGSGWGPSATE
ncbi:MAG: hypothetical protein IPF87_24895 [Gemmatimonadetes bacterium]|nr:hypothetical protein [Gemmatimonadota bacterium]